MTCAELTAPVPGIGADKECCRCGCWKTLSEFHRDRGERDGRRPECADCTNTAARNRRAMHENPQQTALMISRRRPWRTTEESFLNKFYKKRGPSWCSVMLGRTADGVKCHWYEMARRLDA